MSDNVQSDESKFDEFATSYDDALAHGLSATGEDRNYFARGRIQWLRRCLDRFEVRPESAIEFGCGTGSNLPFLIELIGLKSVIGIDISEKSLEVATRSCGSDKVRFHLPAGYQPAGQVDLVFCNGVFHHILPQHRTAALDYVKGCLKPGGLFALWENNPWNPGTRYIMNRVSFDRDAIFLGPVAGRNLLSAAGFEILSTTFLFVFPRILSWLRVLEPSVSRLPLGGQYQVLVRKAC